MDHMLWQRSLWPTRKQWCGRQGPLCRRVVGPVRYEPALLSSCTTIRAVTPSILYFNHYYLQERECLKCYLALVMSL